MANPDKKSKLDLLLELALNPIGSIGLRTRLEKTESTLLRAFDILAPATVTLLQSPCGYGLIECFLDANADSIDAKLCEAITLEQEGMLKVLLSVEGRFVCLQLLKRGAKKELAEGLIDKTPALWWCSNVDALPVLIKALDVIDAERARQFFKDEATLMKMGDSSAGLYCVLRVLHRTIEDPATRTLLFVFVDSKSKSLAGSRALLDVIVYGDVLTEEIVQSICSSASSYSNFTTVSLIIRLLQTGSAKLRELVGQCLCEPESDPLIVRIRGSDLFDAVKTACDGSMSEEMRKSLDKCLKEAEAAKDDEVAAAAAPVVMEAQVSPVLPPPPTQQTLKRRIGEEESTLVKAGASTKKAREDPAEEASLPSTSKDTVSQKPAATVLPASTVPPPVASVRSQPAIAPVVITPTPMDTVLPPTTVSPTSSNASAEVSPHWEISPIPFISDTVISSSTVPLESTVVPQWGISPIPFISDTVISPSTVPPESTVVPPATTTATVTSTAARPVSSAAAPELPKRDVAAASVVSAATVPEVAAAAASPPAAAAPSSSTATWTPTDEKPTVPQQKKKQRRQKRASAALAASGPSTSDPAAAAAAAEAKMFPKKKRTAVVEKNAVISNPLAHGFDPGEDVMAMAMTERAGMIVTKLEADTADLRLTIFACIQNGLMALMMDASGVQLVKWYLANGSFVQKGTIEKKVLESIETLVESGERGREMVRAVMEGCVCEQRKKQMGEMYEKALKTFSPSASSSYYPTLSLEDDDDEIEIVGEKLVARATTTSTTKKAATKEAPKSKEQEKQPPPPPPPPPPPKEPIEKRLVQCFKTLGVTAPYHEKDLIDEAFESAEGIRTLTSIGHHYMQDWMRKDTRKLVARLASDKRLVQCWTQPVLAQLVAGTMPYASVLSVMLCKSTRDAFVVAALKGGASSPMWQFLRKDPDPRRKVAYFATNGSAKMRDFFLANGLEILKLPHGREILEGAVRTCSKKLYLPVENLLRRNPAPQPPLPRAAPAAAAPATTPAAVVVAAAAAQAMQGPLEEGEIDEREEQQELLPQAPPTVASQPTTVPPLHPPIMLPPLPFKITPNRDPSKPPMLFGAMNTPSSSRLAAPQKKSADEDTPSMKDARLASPSVCIVEMASSPATSKDDGMLEKEEENAEQMEVQGRISVGDCEVARLVSPPAVCKVQKASTMLTTTTSREEQPASGTAAALPTSTPLSTCTFTFGGTKKTAIAANFAQMRGSIATPTAAAAAAAVRPTSTKSLPPPNFCTPHIGRSSAGAPIFPSMQPMPRWCPPAPPSHSPIRRSMAPAGAVPKSFKEVIDTHIVQSVVDTMVDKVVKGERRGSKEKSVEPAKANSL